MNEALVSVYGVLVCGYAFTIGGLIDRFGALALCMFIVANDI